MSHNLHPLEEQDSKWNDSRLLKEPGQTLLGYGGGRGMKLTFLLLISAWKSPPLKIALAENAVVDVVTE